MRRIIPKIALALLPLILHFAVFAAFEPNNYFGLQNNTSTNSPIARIRGYQASPQTAVIFGDSRMAHFDMEAVEQVAGRPVSNAAYGGASLQESIDEFYYLYNFNPEIDTVIMSVSFYTLNAAYNPVNRMETVETQLKNPVAFVYNLEYNVNAMTVISDRIRYAMRGEPYENQEETAVHTPDEYVDEQGELPYRKDLIDYAATIYTNTAKQGTAALPQRQYAADGTLLNAREIADYMLTEITPEDSKYSINEQALAELVEMTEFCEQNGIEMTIVLPPMDETLRTLVCEPLGIDEAIKPALETIKSTSATVLDYEWTDIIYYPDTSFFDGFHIDTRNGLLEYTQMLFSEVSYGG